MKQLDLWPLALKQARQAHMLCVLSAAAAEREKQASELRARYLDAYRGIALEHHADTEHGRTRLVMLREYINFKRKNPEYFAEIQNLYDKPKYDGSARSLISQ